jgi:hypothetical protein
MVTASGADSWAVSQHPGFPFGLNGVHLIFLVFTLYLQTLNAYMQLINRDASYTKGALRAVYL